MRVTCTVAWNVFSLGGFFSLDVFFNAATAMALTRGESLVGAILARAASPEQIDNETPMDYCKEFRERRSKTSPRSEERREGKSVDLGGRRIIERKKHKHT